MNGVVVIGEGEKDEAPMLYIGERVGNRQPPTVDVAVDPIDGTRLVARGLPGAIATVAIAEQGSLYCTHVPYMEKLIVGPQARGVIDITDSVGNNLRRIAKAQECSVKDLTVVVLDRPRHEKLLEAIRQAGARVKLIMDGDVAAGLMVAMEPRTGVDVLMGVGGAPEAVLAACAVSCLGGGMQARLWISDNNAHRLALQEGKGDGKRVLGIEELCASSSVFFAATGITDGELLDGVHPVLGGGWHTQTLIMCKPSGTVSYIDTRHMSHEVRRQPDR
jgi:fructose-1,6-bisphosphatase II